MLLTGRRTGIAEQLEALDEVLTLSRERLDPDMMAGAEQIAAKAGDRLRFGEAHTVVALAGATGSGKSSLFNTLVGEPLSQVGMRRPTTAAAHAAVWGQDDATSLLDWLEVPRRHLLGAGTDAELEGLILLDLPDVDSVERSNRLEAERLVERVDLLVWVLDPQKYADAALHERYLAPLAAHADVMLVVLNQIDRLPPEAGAGCVDDLTALLASEGLAAAPVLSASARTGEGIQALRAVLARNVAAKQAAVRRLAADLSAMAERLDDVCAGVTNQVVTTADRTSLTDALSAAAGVDVVSEAVAGAYRLRARRATGWPVSAWTSRLRLDPARRLGLRDEPSDLVRTSLPGPSALQRAHVDNALRRISDRASSGLPQPWPQAIRRAATSSQNEMPDLLDRAVAGTDLGLGRRPHWWRAAGTVQWLFLAAAVAGLVWLGVLFVVAWLQLPQPPLPHWGRLPVPTLLLVLGLVSGFVLAQICGMFARTGARRRAGQARRRLNSRISQLAADTVIAPVERELSTHVLIRSALARMRG
ncbi:50S ribosome-binding GTPase [Kineosporia mesophila]|uniref:50S ribosome-binding GTPase n=1 Tax=Kineosporia mesophila TaxID=566012 RepID=A0ABP6Z984_9ACTN|nr:GTPase [Kineosporia mesophila]